MSLTSVDFWLDALERMVKTVCEVALALIGTGMVGILDVDWLNLLSVCAMSAITSLLASIVSNVKVDTVSGASLVSTSSTPKHASESDDWSDQLKSVADNLEQ